MTIRENIRAFLIFTFEKILSDSRKNDKNKNDKNENQQIKGINYILAHLMNEKFDGMFHNLIKISLRVGFMEISFLANTLNMINLCSALIPIVNLFYLFIIYSHVIKT